MLHILTYVYRGLHADLIDIMAFPSDYTIGLAMELLSLTDYYKMDHFKEWLEQRIVAWEIITISNVCDLSTHAFAANAEQLIEVCIHCLRELVDAVRDTEGWANLPPSIVDDVLAGDAEVKKRRRMAARKRQRDAERAGVSPGE